MSYEGFEVWICKNGHISIHDCYQSPDKGHWRCYHCNEPVSEFGCIDQTNGLPYRLSFKLIKLSGPKYKTCDHCGNKEFIEPARYRFERCGPYESEDGQYIFKEKSYQEVTQKMLELE